MTEIIAQTASPVNSALPINARSGYSRLIMIYAGIDEAGYGPLLGPLTVGASVFELPGDATDAPPPCLWKTLEKAVAKDLTTRKGRIVVADSKKVHTQASGVKHLELGTLCFAACAGLRPVTLDALLDALGETSHHDLSALPWYAAEASNPWQTLPIGCTAGELAIARSVLDIECRRASVQPVSLGASVLFEDEFNRRVAITRSKASVSFTLVAGHLWKVWQKWGSEHPLVAVDRQSGRSHYRELLSQAFPGTTLAILDETSERSGYRISETSRSTPGQQARQMTVWFEVGAEERHMPVALASMIAKYSREALMARLQRWFTHMAPHVEPTAGYGADAKRFWTQIQPSLAGWGVDENTIRRMS